MRTKVFAAAALGILMTTWTAAQEAKTDLDKLQGTWRAVSLEAQGQKAPAEAIEAAELTLTITGDKYVEKQKGETSEEGTLKFHPDKNPRQLDIHIGTGKDKGKTQLAIYKIDGDAFTVAIAPAESKERPESFTTKADTPYAVQVLRREKK